MCSWACECLHAQNVSVFPTVSVGLIKDLTSAWPGHDLGACWPREHPARASVTARLALPKGPASPGAVTGARLALTCLLIQCQLQARSPTSTLGSQWGLSWQTVGRRRLAAAQQSIGASGRMDVIQREHPWEPLGEGSSSCKAPSWQGFVPNAGTRGSVAVHQMVHAVVLWMLLCRNAVLGPG